MTFIKQQISLQKHEVSKTDDTINYISNSLNKNLIQNLNPWKTLKQTKDESILLKNMEKVKKEFKNVFKLNIAIQSENRLNSFKFENSPIKT